MVVVLARELGIEEFGIYSYATTWVAVLLGISGLGYGSVLLTGRLPEPGHCVPERRGSWQLLSPLAQP